MTKEKEQVEKFREAARELKTDQSDAAFEAVVNKIAHAPKLTNEQIKTFVQGQRAKVAKPARPKDAKAKHSK
ncbi:hypothetical protein [Mesorhizobium sp. M7A.F.Ce.TU.012.03.2.1]|uniref:hypothetical protein n=1 Tax=Mesorhizobium sp. M7A.F.Ce.TU.012.03.2.1 TaxID=2493681 RepID=UPI000FDB49F0|nr:hypothetical protein [Mesorhizobium sp. M7A.F.Ce.TU.012.03.2.1]AZV18268.1 hypothetical protein EJ079_03740 [Mesorhizobium sp. M7A.F.Ce.TU.012.03.2.1]